MKKVLFIACSILLSSVAINSFAVQTSVENETNITKAYTSRKYVARDYEGTQYGYILLQSDGTYMMSVDEDYYSGNYYIDTDSYQPGSSYRIVFYINGQSYHGSIIWALNGDECICFDGISFDRER